MTPTITRRSIALLLCQTAPLSSGVGCSSAPLEEMTIQSQSGSCADPACPGDPSLTVPEPATIDIGTGSSCFEPIGAAVPIYGGPQGGFHILLGVRAAQLGERILVEYSISDAASGEVLSLGDPIQLFTDLCPVSAGWMEQAGIYGYLATPEPESDVGREITVWMRVSDDQLVLDNQLTMTFEKVVPWQ